MDLIEARLEELARHARETNSRLTDLTAGLAVNTHVLNEHHKRSNMLEELMKPLQDDLKFRDKLRTLFMGSSGLIAVISLVVAILALARK